MRKNFIQNGKKAEDGRTYLEYDWYDHGIPGNVKLANDVYIDTSYGFAGFHSLSPEGMIMGKGSGCYDRASFIVGENGRIDIGEFTILNGSTLICNNHISVGNHCMFAWGAVITDSWIIEKKINLQQKRTLLKLSASDSRRMMPLNAASSPILIEDNVWVGFDAIILPGVTLGRGCIVGSKSVIADDVPAYAVVAGNPAKIIRYLRQSDTDETKQSALNEFLLSA